ncbi:hypothetical protein AVEN_63619-1 [Araneus ventricosus]|uniref:Uncharacterized protein n=1 Tax=Araneus ventricosus TaxID=182803 RepID=A0A4Y2UIJ6_ARAVE|nr:hypothetical protein AVEN_63619-1 [Araneus ventricosus]
MTRTTPSWHTSPDFRATPTGGRLATTYDLACNRPHTRRIFSGIGFRTCDPPVPRSRPFVTGKQTCKFRRKLLLISEDFNSLSMYILKLIKQSPPLWETRGH